MRIAVAAVAAFFLAAPSAPLPEAHGRYFTGMPPERFQADGVAVVAYVTDIASACEQEPGQVKYACAKEIEGTRVMILPNPCTLGDMEWSARLACHEHAHVQGWTAEHEVK